MSISSDKEPWQIDFENEEINNERWSCLVSAAVESKPDDEECLKILNQFVQTGKIPLVRTVSMSDVVALFKKTTETKKKEETKVKDKPKIDNAGDFSVLTRPHRFPEVVPFLSQYAIISDGSCKFTPVLMAYALKYLILCLKDQDYFQRRFARTARRRTEEAGPLKNDNPKDGGQEELWRRVKFDIFSDPLKDGPFQGPELHIVLHDFYDPSVFPELLRLKVPFRAVIKIENFRLISRKPSGGPSSRKSDVLNNFWSLLEGEVSNGIALLNYAAPSSDDGNIEMSSVIAAGITAVLYSVFNVDRLHQTYIQQMKVHRMIESVEILNLSRCVVYNELCNNLVTEDPNAEIFVLFSMIEQIVAGVPETESRVYEYETKPSSFFTWEEDPVGEEERQEPEESPHNEKSTSRRSGRICFHDDKISIATLSIDSNILQPSEIFKRFLINSISSKIRNKFARLTPVAKAQNDFNFYQLWQNSKEDKDIFRVKVVFFIAMKLIERIGALDITCGNMSFHSEGVSSLDEGPESSGEDTLIQDETRDVYLPDIEDLFYKKYQTEKECPQTFSEATREVRKAEAIADLEKNGSLSFENLEIACGRCPKLSVCEKPEDHEVQVKKLEGFLESYEISHFNDPNLLSNQAKFESFVEKHNFYETFEPNRTVQRLQELFDEYNTIEYTYFSPTDNLFVLGHDGFDFRGVYHTLESGFIPSPLSLRDFVRYILPESKKWMRVVNEKYIKFLQGVWTTISDEEKRRNHALRCGLMNKVVSKSERKFLDDESIGRKGSGLDTKKGTREISTVELEDLPVKVRQKRPDVKFYGLNFGGTRTQVNAVNYEFHSEDGSMVRVKTQSWLDSESIVTLTIRRRDSRLFVHRWLEDTEKRLVLFRDPSGILVTFGLNSHPFPVKITQPNGLLIEIATGRHHIKQSYLEAYRWGDDITWEESRYCLHDGSILVFRADGTVEVLYSSGTKHTCYKFSSDGAEIYETLTPTGELWVRDECSKCKHLEKTMTVMVGVDDITGEIYYTREDGTNCMLWPDGKLVTTFPDGTKITASPKFEEEELLIEPEEEASVLSTTPEKSSFNFMNDSLSDIRNGFTVVTSSYLLEHPKYATVYSEPPKLEVRILGIMKAEMSSEASLRIKSHHLVFKVSPEKAEFYEVCTHCGKRNVSKIFFGSENLLSKTRDYDGRNFYVYSSGQILYKPRKETDDEEEEEDFGEIQPPGKCEYHKTCRSQRRCIIVERDLNGLEFIDADTLHRYLGSLSQDAYYDLGKHSMDKTHLEHSFFDPVYRIGREKYIMKYEKNDGLPTRLTRKDLRDGSAVINYGSSREEARKEIQKTVVVRFIRVLLPDPLTVMKEIAKVIAIYRRRSLDISKKYVNLAKKRKQSPFVRYIAKELDLIASVLCPSLKLYQHTCMPTPHTEMDIHSMGHALDRSNYFVRDNPVDCRAGVVPRCKRMPKPLKHSGNAGDIPEFTVNDDDSSFFS